LQRPYYWGGGEEYFNVRKYWTECRKQLGKRGSSAVRAWMRLVEHYTNRAMTNPEDRLMAIGAVASELKEKTEWHYLFGLWMPHILQMMSWSPPSRQPRRSPRAPSWSWACLDGPVDIRFTTHGKLVVDGAWGTPTLLGNSLHEDVKSLRLRTRICLRDKTKLNEVAGLQMVQRWPDLVEEHQQGRRFWMRLGFHISYNLEAVDDKGLVFLELMHIDPNLYRRTGILKVVRLPKGPDIQKSFGRVGMRVLEESAKLIFDKMRTREIWIV
jgi:hypothetical protein